MSATPSRGPSRTPSAPPPPSHTPSSSSRPSQAPSKAPGSSSTALLSRLPSRAPSSSAPTVSSSPSFARARPNGPLPTVPEHDNDDNDNDNNENNQQLLTAAIPSALAPSAAALPRTPTAPAPALRSVYNDPEDLRRASLQSSYATLTPAERASQDAWATRKASEFAPCPYDFAWVRHGMLPGYACAGGAHFMSDAILAEGIPGLYVTMYAHRDLEGCDRKPPASEQVPHGYWGPVRPVGLDSRGNFTYFWDKVDRAKSKTVDSAIGDVLGWTF
ncbi:hypothetical protein F5X96DRAFT_684126 [Biscogniauxia mediterranea]|nr:hypothetical protein F5X96DRAFT_684126 [Biscogniauxia mediterranea]